MRPNPMVMSRRIIAGGILVCVAAGGAAAGENDLRDLRVGMSVHDIPPAEYVDLVCAASPEQKLVGWAEFRQCPADAAGLHAVSFHFNDSLNPLAQVNDKYEGTRVAGHPVVLTLLIATSGIVERLRIDSDPKARLFLRKKAHLLALVVKVRYGDAGWQCFELVPTGGESPVGGVFVNEHCVKAVSGRIFYLDRAVYRRPGQPTNDFVNETHLEIRRVAD
jgi:hypothetical protein